MEYKDHVFLYGSFLLLSCTLFSPAAAATEKTVVHRAENSYCEPMTGKIFPPRIGTFIKNMVKVSPSKIIGTRITYHSRFAGGDADLYLYALHDLPQEVTSQEFKLHREKTFAFFRKSFRGNKAFSHVKELSPDRISFRLGGKKFQSRVYMFPYKKWVIKVMLTLPEEQAKKDTAAFIRGLHSKVFPAEKGKRPSSSAPAPKTVHTTHTSKK